MSAQKIVAVLKLHQMESKEEGGRVYGLLIYTEGGVVGEEWVDMTGWSWSQLMVWLGY